MDDINKILNNRDQSVILYNFKAKINLLPMNRSVIV